MCINPATPFELLELKSCKYKSKNKPCSRLSCTCLKNGLRCCDFCECGDDCQNQSETHNTVLDPDDINFWFILVYLFFFFNFGNQFVFFSLSYVWLLLVECKMFIVTLIVISLKTILIQFIFQLLALARPHCRNPFTALRNATQKLRF